MNVANALNLLYRRWWVILSVTVLAVVVAAGYSLNEATRYQATATVLVHPTSDANSASVFSDELNLLSYGSLTETFASLARSPSMIRSAAGAIGVSADAASHYSATGSLIPQTTVLEVSVDGPDPNTVVKLANQLVTQVSDATTQYFHIIQLTSLDAAAPPATQTQPKTARNLAIAAAAGLLLGSVIAALSIAGRSAHKPVLEAGSTITTWVGTHVANDKELQDPPLPDPAVPAARRTRARARRRRP